MKYQPVWIDAELHMLPPRMCSPKFSPPVAETAIRERIYNHPLSPEALAIAHEEPLIEMLKANTISGGILMGLPWRNPELCRESNAYVVKVVQHHPGRFIACGVLPSPNLADPLSFCRECADQGVLGFKLIPSWHGVRLDDSAYEPMFGFMEEKALFLVPHTDHAYCDPGRSDTIHALMTVAKRHPGLPILAPHLGGGLAFYALHRPIAERIENILFLSSVAATMPMVGYVIQAAGVHKVAYGSDHPFIRPLDISHVRSGVEALGLSASDLAAVAGGNLCRFLGEYEVAIPEAWDDSRKVQVKNGGL